MRRIIILPIFVSAVALAEDYSSQTQYTHTSSSATALSRSASVGVGIASGGSAAGGAGVGNGGTASLTYNEAPAASQRGTVTVKNTPEVSASNIAPTAPCMGGVSIGGSGPGFGVVFGGTWKDGDCSLRETARSFSGLGLTQDAIAILCASEYAAAAPSCIALKAKMPSNDSEIDFQSTTWKAMENRISMRLDYFRRQNDGYLSETATAMLRGRIAELKDFLALAKDPDKVTDEQ